MFLLIFLISLLLQFHSAEKCDFVMCVNGVRSYIFDLSVNRGSFNCQRLSDIPFCSEHCMHRYFPNVFSHSEGQLSFTSYCKENISRRSNWSCIARHSYRLFACLANVNSLTTNNVRDDVMLAETCSSCLCRKYLDFQNCPKEVLLADCGQESSNVVKDLILFILDNYQLYSCKGANVKEVLSMPIYYQLGRNFVSTAKSLDEHNDEVRKCFTQYLQDEIDLDGYICGNYDPGVSKCVDFILETHGKSYPDVKRLLLKIIALSGFKCKQSSFVPEIVSTSHSSELEKVKPDIYPFLKNDSISDSYELSVSKKIEISNNDLKLTPESSTYPKTEVQEKSEFPMKDSFDINKNNKIINLNDSGVINSKSHKNQNVNSINKCSKISISVFTYIFCFILLFVFR